MANTANITANSTITTDFNVTPYYDDFDRYKNYFRILFKPGFAVQARELTQTQSMLQNQIYQFGSHVFDYGSKVLLGEHTFYANNRLEGPIPYATIKDLDNSNNEVSIQNFLGQKVTGATTGIYGRITDVLDNGFAGPKIPTTKTIYIDYGSASNANSAIRTFQPDEVLISNVGNLVVQATGKGSKFEIGDGIFFAKDHFISFPKQSIIVDPYSADPTAKIGFTILESIVKSSDDASLLDPALEASNYAAPGADRFKLNPVLTVLNYDDNSGPPEFVTLLTVKDGIVQQNFNRPQYNVLQKEMAIRTFDESGDYYVNGMNIQIREHDDSGTNFGKYANGNTQLLFVGVEPGKSYVKGYEINVEATRELSTPKSFEYSAVRDQTTTSVMGSYVTVDEFVGAWELDIGKSINLYKAAQNRISGRTWSTGSPSASDLVGTALVQSIEYNSGTPGYDAKYDVYLSDIQMLGSNAFSSVRSIYQDNTPHSDIGADIVLDISSGNAVLKDAAGYPLLYYAGSDHTRKIRSIDNEATTDMNYLFYKNFGITSTITMTGTGQFSISVSGEESFPYTAGSLSDIPDSKKRADIIVTLNESFNIALPGTVNATGGTKTLNGASTYFSRLNVGDKIEVSGNNQTWYITAINSDLSLTVDNPLPASLSGNLIFKAYDTGDIIDFSKVGSDSGQQRTIAATSTQLSFDAKETALSGKSVSVLSRVSRSGALEVVKTLRPIRYVKIDCSSHPSGTTGPYSLGFTDVYKIRKILKKTSSYPSSMSDTSATDVTNSFVFDNGQRDTHYDLATITPKINLVATDRLLIELDYFGSDFTSRSGYYTIDSYPINDDNPSSTEIRTENVPVYKSPTTGINYDLRNYIDFRPIKAITAVDAADIGSASINPSGTSTYDVPANGLRLSVPSERVTYDYSYYMGRIDLVCVSQEGLFTIVRGLAAPTPITPTNIPDDSMVLGLITIPPFPSLSPAYAQSLNKKSIAAKVRKVASVRYTMRDIGVLKNRIENLEYYAQLSLLEKAASDLLIQDENGLDRFKNGIFVDSFNSHSLGATQLPDYRIVVDEKEKSIRPLYTTKVFGFDLVSNTNTVVNNNMITLPYTEVSQLKVNAVTTIRNIERSSYVYVGRLNLIPSEDIWIDTSFAPDENLYVNGATLSNDPNDPGSPTGSVRVIETTWEAWKKYVTGYNIYTGSGTNKVLVATAATRQEADNIAGTYRNSTDVTIETVYNNQRLGTELFATEYSDSATTGYKVVDVSEIPYIRPQTIYVSGRGLKPYSRLYTFFDNEDLKNYVTPLNTTQYDALTDEDPSTVATGLQSEGSELRVSANGDVLFAMRLDENKRFLTGTKSVIVTDSPTNTQADATTGAVAYFTAAGTKVVKQRTIYSTKNEIIYSRDIQQNYSSSDFEVLAQIQQNTGGSCFDPNALVTMENGSKKRIADIVIGDRVLSGNGKDINTVIGMEEVRLENRKMYKFNETWAFVSEEHPLLTNKGWAAFNPTSWAVEEEFIGKLALIDVGTEIAKYDGTYEKIETIDTLELDPDYLIYNLMLDGDHTYIVEDYVVHNKKSCLAYSFLAKAPSGEEGMFLSSVDVFIAEKDPTLGIWFEIREMDDAGGITRTQVPMSEVWFNSDEVPISTDGKTNPLKVKFKVPIFLFNNTQYAFVIHTENVNPNYYIWIARAGLNDRNTGIPYTNRPLTGTFYTTNNNLNWDIVPDVDLTCEFYRASFPTNTEGTAVLSNKATEKFVFNSVDKPLSGSLGDVYTAGDRITFSSANGTFSLGDFVKGNTSGANAFITSIIASGSRIAMANNGYVSGEKIDAYYGSNLVYKGVSATVSSVVTPIATLSEYDENSKQISGVFIKSNGQFRANDIIKSSRDSSFKANVKSIQNFRYSVISLEPSYLKFRSTDVKFAIKGYSNTGTPDGSYTNIIPEETYYYDTEKALYSRSNEILSLSGDRTLNVQVKMSTISSYVSPLLDLDKSSAIYVDNIINSNTKDEALSTYGYLTNKYISKTITLAEGQDAEDIRVVLTAYRPPTTDVKVWIKILHAQDSESLTQKGWIELERSTEGEATFSSLTNRDDFKEYTYTVPSANSNTQSGIITYTNSSNINFEGYKYFAVKIGLLGENSAIVPRVADLRAIALQM